MKGDLPDVHELPQFIDYPLLDEEKIPITPKQMSLLVSPPSVGMDDNFCHQEKRLVTLGHA